MNTAQALNDQIDTAATIGQAAPAVDKHELIEATLHIRRYEDDQNILVRINQGPAGELTAAVSFQPLDEAEWILVPDSLIMRVDQQANLGESVAAMRDAAEIAMDAYNSGGVTLRKTPPTWSPPGPAGVDVHLPWRMDTIHPCHINVLDARDTIILVIRGSNPDKVAARARLIVAASETA